MADPMTIATIALMGMGMIQSQQASSQQASMEAAVGELNALQLERAAYEVQWDMASRQLVADMEAAQVRRAGEEVRAVGRVAIAGAGVVVDAGSALNWSRGLEADIQADMVRLEHNFRSEMVALQRHQHHLTEQAKVARYMGQIGAATATMQGQTALLSGAAGMAQTYHTMTRDPLRPGGVM